MIVFLLKACAILDETQCEVLPFAVDSPTLEACMAQAPKHLPEMLGNLAVARPDLKFAAYGCSEMGPGTKT